MKAMQKAQQTILVFDDSKIGKIQQAYIGEVSQFDLVICNVPFSNEQLPDDFS